MIVLPLPLVSSLILGFLFLRLIVQGARAPWVAALLGGVALQGVLITLAQHHGIDAARMIQPVTAMALPAFAWLAWMADGLGKKLRWRDIAHLFVGPVLALGLGWTDTLLLEALISLAYAGYAAALAISLTRTGPDLPRGRLGQGGAPRLLWAGVAAALLFSGVSDLGIAIVIAIGHAAWAPVIVDVATSMLLFGMGLLMLGVERVTGRADANTPTHSAPSEEDHVLFARLEELMNTRRPWRDPDLTLAQLARRLSVPAKRLSAAVNLVTGDNISRYVNTHRITAACAALKTGANATEAMLEAGFITKSNFNREFRRVTGQTPTRWRTANTR